MKLMYFIEKIGIYSHGVYGIFDSKHEAVKECEKFAKNDIDNHHEYIVVKTRLNQTHQKYGGYIDDWNSISDESENVIFRARKSD